jgi:hypothetical protein
MTPTGTQMLAEALNATKAVVVSGGKDAATVEYVPDWTARLTALEILYSRQWGKPSQAVTGEDGGPIAIDIVSVASVLESIAKGKDEGKP